VSFVTLLLPTCERDAGPLFQQLCRAFDPVLRADPAFAGVSGMQGIVQYTLSSA
jgi:hypothetical protein